MSSPQVCLSKYRKSFLYLFRIPNTLTVLQRRNNDNTKLTQNILKIAKTHQSFLIQPNRKQKFYSFQTRQQEIPLLGPYTNHRDAQWQHFCRTSNHILMMEYGRYWTPKIPEHLRFCQYCSINEIEDEQHFMLNCTTLMKDNISLILYLSQS